MSCPETFRKFLIPLTFTYSAYQVANMRTLLLFSLFSFICIVFCFTHCSIPLPTPPVRKDYAINASQATSKIEILTPKANLTKAFDNKYTFNAIEVTAFDGIIIALLGIVLVILLLHFFLHACTVRFIQFNTELSSKPKIKKSTTSILPLIISCLYLTLLIEYEGFRYILLGNLNFPRITLGNRKTRILSRNIVFVLSSLYLYLHHNRQHSMPNPISKC